jgi:GntR family transcriptional regulator
LSDIEHRTTNVRAPLRESYIMAVAPEKINRRPVALQVRDDLRRRVATGDLAGGDQLPPEIECAEAYGVSRATVREAYKLLEQEGLIVIRPGLGRFVLPNARRDTTGPVSMSINMFSSMTDFLESAGYEVSTLLLSVAKRPATQDEADVLLLPAGADVVHIERFRLGDGTRLVYALNTFDARLVGGSVEHFDWNHSLIALLEARGRRVQSAVVDVQAVNLPGEIAAAHELPACSAWLLLRAVHFDAKGIPFLLSRDYVRGDVRTLHVVQHNDA